MPFTPTVQRRACRWGLSLVARLFLIAPACVRGQFTLATNNGTITIVRYTNSDDTVIVPDTTNGLPVTTIASYAFAGGSFSNLTIGANITSIGNDAFTDCNNLTTLAIPGGVTNLGTYSFSYCLGLNNVSISCSGAIGQGAFFGCNILADVTIGQGVTGIGVEAFLNCTNLRSVSISDSVGYIGLQAFSPCRKLTSLTLGSGITNLARLAFIDCSSLGRVVLPASLSTMGSYTFEYCTNLQSIYFKGNAPAADSTVFQGDSGTVFYLAGTSGWGNSFGGLPAVLWNPSVETSDGSFGPGTNGFGFTVTGTTNIPILVEAAKDPGDSIWLPLQTNTLNGGTFYFSDPAWTNFPARFYRIAMP